MNLYDEIKTLLVKRGWKIDASAKEDAFGELHEFIHPDTDKRMAYIDAIFAEEERELRQEEKVS